MRAAIFLFAFSAAGAQVVSRDWEDGKLTLHLNRGAAEIEWIGETSFHFSRGGAPSPVKHDPVAIEFQDVRNTLTLRGRYMSVEIDKATANLRVTANQETVATLAAGDSGLHVAPLGKVFGLSGPGDSRRFFFTSGFGMFVRAPKDCAFDLDQGLIRTGPAFEVFFYYGPTPKEIFEHHQKVTGKTEARSELPATPLDSWDSLAQLVRTLTSWSLSAVLYPALNLSTLPASKGEIAKRAADLAAMLPVLAGDESAINPATRHAWEPYLATYLREAYDRGYPVIRPLSFEFPRDRIPDSLSGVFLLGDEVLLAPVVEAGTRRALSLPRGKWTDLRTNIEYAGNESIEVDAPTGQTPAFARNGSIVPLAGKNAMELHYFPSLGGEFFLWEPGARDNSQFHAAPAGDLTRLEIESKVTRTYEWVIHHANRPSSVEGYRSVRQRSALQPGAWWHDRGRKDLHIVMRAEAGTDKIVNIAF